MSEHSIKKLYMKNYEETVRNYPDFILSDNDAVKRGENVSRRKIIADDC
jgi:hypothetical protein